MSKQKWETICAESVVDTLSKTFDIDASFDCNDLKVLIITLPEYPRGLKIESGWQSITFKQRKPIREEEIYIVSFLDPLDKIERHYECLDYSDAVAKQAEISRASNWLVEPTITESTRTIWE